MLCLWQNWVKQLGAETPSAVLYVCCWDWCDFSFSVFIEQIMGSCLLLVMALDRRVGVGWVFFQRPGRSVFQFLLLFAVLVATAPWIR
jgi:hypothetical protein